MAPCRRLPVTTDWRAFLDWMMPEERRSLLDTESAAVEYAQALRSAGLPTAGAFADGPLGDPADVIERSGIVRSQRCMKIDNQFEATGDFVSILVADLS